MFEISTSANAIQNMQLRHADGRSHLFPSHPIIFSDLTSCASFLCSLTVPLQNYHLQRFNFCRGSDFRFLFFLFFHFFCSTETKLHQSPTLLFHYCMSFCYTYTCTTVLHFANLLSGLIFCVHFYLLLVMILCR